MHVCAIASARDSIGGPTFESRTPCRSAWFQRTTTFSASLTGAARSLLRPRREGTAAARSDQRSYVREPELRLREGQAQVPAVPLAKTREMLGQSRLLAERRGTAADASHPRQFDSASKEASTVPPTAGALPLSDERSCGVPGRPL